VDQSSSASALTDLNRIIEESFSTAATRIEGNLAQVVNSRVSSKKAQEIGGSCNTAGIENVRGVKRQAAHEQMAQLWASLPDCSAQPLGFVLSKKFRAFVCYCC